MGNATSFSSGEQVSKKLTERLSSESLQMKFAVSGMKGRRQRMEDRHLYSFFLPVFGLDNINDHSIFAVFDGHGGDFTSNFLADNFLLTLSKRPEMGKYAALPDSGPLGKTDANGFGLLREALVKTFLQLDEELLPLQEARNSDMLQGKMESPVVEDSDDDNDNNEQKWSALKKSGVRKVGERSGSTAVVVILTPAHIICANTGDSRAMLRRDGRAVPLSFDHKPTNLPESMRIAAAGGTVKNKRVNGDLAVSRALGDFAYKTKLLLASDQQIVIPHPDIVSYPRDAKVDEFIVLACDGIWDVASSNQCAEYVQVLLSEGETDMGNICEEILDTCLDRKSRDNMTVMLVGLPAMKAETSGTTVVSNTLWGRRTSRRVGEVADSATTTCCGKDIILGLVKQ